MVDINLMGFFFVSLNIVFFAEFLLADVALMRVFGSAFGYFLDFFVSGTTMALQIFLSKLH